MYTAHNHSLRFLLPFLLVISFLPSSTRAANNKFPDDLQQWIPWVLYEQEEKTCSLDASNSDTRYCTWPSSLELDVKTDGAKFKQIWFVEARSLVPLPGNSPFWPEEVKSNGKKILLSKDQKHPAVWLDPGKHIITGSFSWNTLPESLLVPPATGLINLSLSGKKIKNIQLDQQGRLWFRQKKSISKDSEESLTVQVFRKITDGVPLIQQLYIQLTVSGNPRQITLGLENQAPFIPLALQSPLPARLDNKSRLQLQVRPGQWQIQLTLRNIAPLSPDTLGRGHINGPWPTEEIWVFAANPKLRQIEIKNLLPVDPSRTSLPEQWKRFPAYLIKGDGEMKILEKNRGNPNPVPNRLKLSRKIWLDEQGTGLTVLDSLSGTMTRGWRLNVDPSQSLGKVDIEGQSRLITQMNQTDKTGVEVRLGTLALQAESRINKTVQNGRLEIPALGWDHTFQQLSAVLNLPPGWKLLTATGVDKVSTWLNRWTLLDIFIVLIIGLATAKILGFGWGTVAILLLFVSYHQPGSPRYLWLPLLALLAIQKMISAKTGERICRISGFVILIAIIVGSVPYMINEIRVGIFPQLEFGDYYRITEEHRRDMEDQVTGAASMVEDIASQSPSILSKSMGKMNRVQQQYSSRSPTPRKVKSIQIDPNELIQTGPGLPEWRWKEIHLRWNGPVTPEQKISFILISPRINTILAFIRVILLTALIGGFLRQCLVLGKTHRVSKKQVSLGLFFCLLVPLSFAPQNAQAEMPSQEILTELQNRLLKAPDCAEQCATINSCLISVENDVLQVELQLDTLIRAAVALPGKDRFFDTILLNNKPAKILRQDARGTPLVRLEPGSHTLVLKKTLIGREKLSFSFPLLPEHGQTILNNWTINGLHADGRLEKQISLNRIKPVVKKDTNSEEIDNSLQIPAFVRIERTLHMGLKWTVATRIIRRSPNSVIGLDIPLLPGEHVTTEALLIQNKHVRINMAADQNTFSYFSAINPVDSLILSAPETTLWTEVWFLDVSPIWHLETKGLPEVNQTSPAGKRYPEFRPYPGESLTLLINRPKGVPGPTMTINRSKRTISPGLRSTETTLRFSLIASRGLQHGIILPANIDLQKSLINGKEFPLQLENNRLIIPIQPGKQDVEIGWRSKKGIETKLITEIVDLGIDNVNTSIELKVPASRWILLVGGPQIGPAVLFWGEFLVIILFALLLGRIKLTPLSTLQWLLLSIGLSQIPAALAGIVVAWLLLLGLRKQRGQEITQVGTFNVAQVLLVLLSLAALASLFFAIQQGLLGHPDMQIGGNGSNGHTLRWYQDRSDSLLPAAWVITVPLLAYRVSMLLWALWLAMALLRWLRWGWDCFSDGTIWKKAPPRKKSVFKPKKKTAKSAKTVVQRKVKIGTAAPVKEIKTTRSGFTKE